MSTNVSRVNITLPKDLVSDLRDTIPARERSKIISEALKKEIAMIKREKSLKKLKGIWTKAGGVSLKTDADVRAWRKSLWSTTDKRLLAKIRG